MLLVVALTVVVIRVSEHQRPGFFYDQVWARVQGVRDLRDWGEAYQNRRLAADFARDAAAWPGVVRVGWPDVQVVDGDTAKLERQLASVTVVVDPDEGRVDDLAARALAQSTAAAELGLRLDVTLLVDDLELVLTDTAGPDLDLAVDVFEVARDDDRVGSATVSLAAYGETPGDMDMFYLLIRTRQEEDARPVRQDLCLLVAAADAKERRCSVGGPP